MGEPFFQCVVGGNSQQFGDFQNWDFMSTICFLKQRDPSERQFTSLLTQLTESWGKEFQNWWMQGNDPSSPFHCYQWLETNCSLLICSAPHSALQVLPNSRFHVPDQPDCPSHKLFHCFSISPEAEQQEKYGLFKTRAHHGLIIYK